MEPVLRALGCYLLLLIVVRLSGKRGLAQVTIFDLVLLLLISLVVLLGIGAFRRWGTRHDHV